MSIVRLSWISSLQPDETQNDDDVRTMFSVFGQHSTRGPIELDASLIRSAEQILKKFASAQELQRDQASTGGTGGRS